MGKKKIFLFKLSSSQHGVTYNVFPRTRICIRLGAHGCIISVHPAYNTILRERFIYHESFSQFKFISHSVLLRNDQHAYFRQKKRSLFSTYFILLAHIFDIFKLVFYHHRVQGIFPRKRLCAQLTSHKTFRGIVYRVEAP